MHGTLSIVATPIGNLEDMTFRAVRVLGEADVVLCEDTRVTGKLLKHYGIAAALKRCDAHKEATCAAMVVEYLRDGKHVAYVTDAGTPGVSDPGARLVHRVRCELPETIIESIPGPSSLAAALSVAGLDTTAFTFLGFLPHKKGRETLFAEIAGARHPMIFFESTHRIMKTLASLAAHLDAARRVIVVRELTKLHEEVLDGTAYELHERLAAIPEKQKGEFVVIVDV